MFYRHSKVRAERVRDKIDKINVDVHQIKLWARWWRCSGVFASMLSVRRSRDDWRIVGVRTGVEGYSDPGGKKG